MKNSVSDKVYALSGFACNGKSTFCNYIKNKYSDVKIHIIDEYVRDVYNPDEDKVINQFRIILNAIDSHSEINSIRDKYDLIFTDRSIIDCIIFTEMIIGMNMNFLLDSIEEYIRSFYDKIIYVPVIYDKIDECLKTRFNVGNTRDDFLIKANNFDFRFREIVDRLNLNDMVIFMNNIGELYNYFEKLIGVLNGKKKEESGQ